MSERLPKVTRSPKAQRRLGAKVIKRPVIDRYADYRAYLRDLYAHLKSKSPAYSYRVLAEACNLRSPSFLHLVMSGKRNLGKEAATLDAVARGFGLSQRETKLFLDLVALNQANDVEQRGKQLRKMVRRRSFREFQRLDGDMLEFLQTWQAVAIHALADAPEFRADPVWIANRFPDLTRKQAQHALELLVRIGLLRILEDGRVESLQPHLATPDEVQGEVVRQYHLQVTRLAARAMNSLPANQRNFGAVTARIPQEKLPEVIAYVHRVANDFHAFVSSLETAESTMVVHANFQLFPLTKTPQVSS